MLPGEHCAIISTSIKLPFSIKTFVLSIFKWLLKTGFTVYSNYQIIRPLNKSVYYNQQIVFFLFFSQSIYVVGNQKNRLSETVLLNTQKKMFKLMGKKIHTLSIGK